MITIKHCLPPAVKGVITLEADTTYDLSDSPSLREEEWRPELDAADNLTDEEREAAAAVLRRMAKPQVFTDVDIRGSSSMAVASVQHAIHRMWPAVWKANSAMRQFGAAATKLGRIMGQNHDLVVMDDLTSDRPRPTADQLMAHGWWSHPQVHGVIEDTIRKRIGAPPLLAFPPKIEGETVVPGIGRICVDPRPAHVGKPIWRFGQSAPLPPDKMPEPGTLQGHRPKAAQPPLRRIPARSARGRHRKQRR